MEIGKGVEFERVVVQGNEAAQESPGHLKYDVAGGNSRSVIRERSPTSGPFSGVAEDQSYQDAGIEERVSHGNRGGHLEPENQFPLPPELRQGDPQARYQSGWLE